MNAQSTRRICPIHKCVIADAPREEISLELVPLEVNRRGFVPRIAPLTKAEREAVLAGSGLAMEVQ